MFVRLKRENQHQCGEQRRDRNWLKAWQEGDVKPLLSFVANELMILRLLRQDMKDL